ncbi:MAG: hypothetical protein ACRENI_01560 [Gemmatimonadaceae bacterium]
MLRRSHALVRLARIAVILFVVAGCDKARELAGGSSGAPAAEPPLSDRLDLSAKPEIVFQLFGERDEPRMMPLAALVDGVLKPIVLASNGWRQLDALYLRPGATYTLYRSGRAIGTVAVERGMWEDRMEQLYTLPNCLLMTPMASVNMDASGELGYVVEFIATAAGHGRSAADKGSRTNMDAGEAERIARSVGSAAATGAGLAGAAINALELASTSIAAGATSSQTVVASFTDPRASERAAAGEETTHLFVIADRGAGGVYEPTFVHKVSGDAADAEQRRYIDHLDLTRDGTDEIILEVSQYDRNPMISILGFANGKWSEIFRSRESWCLDRG